LIARAAGHAFVHLFTERRIREPDAAVGMRGDIVRRIEMLASI
jgi:hypothetical protein